MSEPIMVSVICNVYNHEKYVRDALEGFVMQKTSFPFEVLVHDDASTDSSAAIIREYEEKYPHLIKPIYQTVNQYSQKKSITREFQVPRAQGKYFAMCEGDDYWTDPLKLQKQVTFLQEHPEYSMCTCSVVWLDMRTNTQGKLGKTAEDRDVSLEELVLEKNGRVFQYATYVLRREVLTELPEWAKRFGVGDTALAMYATLCGKVRMFAQTMAVYRNHAEGSWTSKVSQNADFKIQAFQKMIGGLTLFNEATEHRYHDVASARILQLRYKIARLQRDWRALCTGELKSIYRKKSFRSRVMDFLYCKAPRLYAIVTKIMR